MSITVVDKKIPQVVAASGMNLFKTMLGLVLALGLVITQGARADEKQEIDALFNQLTKLAGEYNKLIYEADSYRATNLSDQSRKDYVERVRALMEKQAGLIATIQSKSAVVGDATKPKGVLTSFYWLQSVFALLLGTGFGVVSWDGFAQLNPGTLVPGGASVVVLIVWGIAELIASDSGSRDWYRLSLSRTLGLEKRIGTAAYERLMKEAAYRLAEIYSVSSRDSRGRNLPWRQILDKVQMLIGERYAQTQCSLEFSTDSMLLGDAAQNVANHLLNPGAATVKVTP